MRFNSLKLVAWWILRVKGWYSAMSCLSNNGYTYRLYDPLPELVLVSLNVYCVVDLYRIFCLRRIHVPINAGWLTPMDEQLLWTTNMEGTG